MHKWCEDANWREEAATTCSIRIDEAIAERPHLHPGVTKEHIEMRVLCNEVLELCPGLDMFAVAVDIKQSFYYSIIEELLDRVERHQIPLGFYEKVEFIHYHSSRKWIWSLCSLF